MIWFFCILDVNLLKIIFTDPTWTIKLLLTLPVPIPDEGRKLTYIFVYTLLCGTSKGFMKALKAPQRSEKINIKVNSYFNTTF